MTSTESTIASPGRFGSQKEKRLRLLAKRAGDLMVKSYDPFSATNLRSKHFLQKMNKILWALCVHAQGISNE